MLQVTRNSFARHLWAVWKDHNFKDDLISGFKKTGLFPYNKDVVLSRAYKVLAVGSSLCDSPRKKKFLDLTNIVLSEYAPRCGIKSAQVDAMMESLKAHINGKQSFFSDLVCQLF